MNNIKILSTDVLVIGGGTAGLRAAVSAAESGASVIILQKGPPGMGIVGFNSPTSNPADNPSSYFENTVSASGYIGNPALIAILANEAIDEVSYLEGLGISFQHENTYAPHLTSGNQVARTIYTTDKTGPNIIQMLTRKSHDLGVKVFHRKQAISLLKKDLQVIGAVIVDTEKWELEAYFARAVVLATGGIGQLFTRSTNPKDLSADGYALAYQANAELVDMEFVQFEPFVLLAPRLSEVFTVSFLLDNHPKIYNSHHEEFLKNGGEGLGKDEISRAIFEQLRSGNGSPLGGIYFDLTSVKPEKIKEHERFLSLCKSVGIDPRREPLEAGPAQHYMSGGVRIDKNCASSVLGLYAAGEVAGGIHGAGRLAGNSGTDVLVFGACAGRNAAKYARNHDAKYLNKVEILEQAGIHLDTEKLEYPTAQKLASEVDKIKQIMWDNVGIIRTRSEMDIAFQNLSSQLNDVRNIRASSLTQHIKILEIKNQCLIGKMITWAALTRQESRGVHFRSDFPIRDDLKWLKKIVFWREENLDKIGFLLPDYLKVEIEKK